MVLTQRIAMEQALEVLERGDLLCEITAAGILRTALAEPAEQEPNAFGVLFAVEQAIQNGDCPWQIEQAFDEYEAERKNGITKEGE